MTRTSARRVVTWGAAGLALGALISLSLIPRPVACDLDEVVRGDLQVTLDHEGKTRVRDRFVISAPLPGRVLRIELEPGDRVRAGETILATFQPSDPVPLDARSRAEARARVKAAQAALDRARAQRDRVQAEHDFAMRERERLRRLDSQGIVAKGELDAAEAEALAQAEALLAAEAGVRNSVHELELANASLLEPGEADSGGTVLNLRSPVDGVVLRRLRQSEAVVPTGEPLLEVADLDDLEIVADFLSTDAVRTRPGMAVLLDRWGGDEVLRGQVRRVEPSGFMKVSALGVEEQRVNVIVDLLDPDRATALGDAFRVEVRVIVQSLEDVVKAPTSSLFRHGEGWAVFVTDGRRARLQEVELGRRNDTEAEIRSGLATGETVVVHPSEQVVDGIRIARRDS